MTVVGVGVTAWARSGVAGLVANYSVVAGKKAQENNQLGFPVIVGKPKKQNTSSILSDRGIQQYLESLPEPKWLLVYKSTERVEELADKLGMKLIGNRAEVRDRYEDKRQFRVVGKEAGLPLPEGETVKIDDLRERKLNVVLQLTDYSRGGGVGTWFMRKMEDWNQFDEFVRRRRQKRKLEWVNVTRLIEGTAASITGCVTRYGVLTGVVQGQIVDQPELSSLAGRSGVWLGHDWSGQRFSERVQMKAEKIVIRLGEYMAKKGYRGIFGVDLVVDKDEGIWPIECNSRYTGAFPTYTWACIRNGEVPLDKWHLLEFMDMPYKMDFEKVQERNRQPKEGAQILMHNLERGSVRVEGEVRAGIYEFQIINAKCQIKYKKPGWNLLHLHNENELVLTDGVPLQGQALKPAERLGRLLFNRAIVDKIGRLLPEIQEVVRELYQKLQLRKNVAEQFFGDGLGAAGVGPLMQAQRRVGVDF